jgi:hypothetical protein
MSCTNRQYQKSLLNASSGSQTLLTNATVPFTTTNLLDGCSIQFTGGSTISLVKPGVYLVSVDANVAESGTAGIISMQIQKNGVNINGAKASVDSSATGDAENIHVTTLVKVLPSCCMVNNNANITVLNSGVGAVYSNANITVVKLC